MILILTPIVIALAYRFVPIPGTILMVERALQGMDVRRIPVPLTRISPYLVRSVIASEDAKFCSHNGFDWIAIQKAVKSNERGRRLRGGSTISQQTAKNVFLWPERSWLRKGLETGFTVLIETVWPKRRIMEAYLNVAEFGPGIFGAEAGALYHFGKPAKDLSPLEAARMAAILPSPGRWSPTNPSRRIARKSNAIVKGARMVRESGLSSCIYPPKKKSQ
ncbi:monofunctional biosynthetic peptidoglycan transglycosylase [Candidatus Phycosocius spiralis]|uniref:Biosynthetic peptidoglycan transglycosylase n=2 Tax=Candidatus Phycosocius spiralis TaxID=2815099 RepID=A0ABQ4PT98_9PROT|nr:monofunctional biosynthetic peptidoglycan transglycosylase [Candidatus Phycosocius spiralis]